MVMYKQIATAIGALQQSEKDNRQDNIDAWKKVLHQLDDALPSGSGFDNGTIINRQRSTPEKLVLDTAFHHMDSNGCYTAWSDITVTVRPSLRFDIDLHLNFHGYAVQDKDYFYEVFHSALTAEAHTTYQRENTGVGVRG